MQPTVVTTHRKIKDCGHKESWLRDQIEINPGMLGLGELMFVSKEVVQFQGGRLDLLLKDPEDESMYEVELQLGDTNPDHIIRAIEYWDRMKRRYPKRKHIAVLVAEEITSRFFNVVQLLANAVPIIGIKVCMVQIGDAHALHFTTIIDTSEDEEREEEEGPQTDEKFWRDRWPAVVDCATWYREMLAKCCGDVPMKLGKTMITLYVDETVRVSLWPKRNNRADVRIEKFDETTLVEADTLLNKERTVFARKGRDLIFTGNLQQLKDTASAHEWIAQRIAKDNRQAPDRISN